MLLPEDCGYEAPISCTDQKARDEETTGNTSSVRPAGNEEVYQKHYPESRQREGTCCLDKKERDANVYISIMQYKVLATIDITYYEMHLNNIISTVLPHAMLFAHILYKYITCRVSK